MFWLVTIIMIQEIQYVFISLKSYVHLHVELDQFN